MGTLPFAVLVIGTYFYSRRQNFSEIRCLPANFRIIVTSLKAGMFDVSPPFKLRCTALHIICRRKVLLEHELKVERGINAD